MIQGATHFSDYKDSGQAWLGPIPAHWKIQKLKHLTRFINGLPFKPSDWSGTGVPIIRIQNLNGSDKFNYTKRKNLPDDLRIKPGELLFAWSGNRGTSFGPFIWNHSFEGYLNQHIFKLTAYNLDTRYFAAVLRAVTAHIEEEKTHGIIGLVHVTKPELAGTSVPIAPPDEQASIVQFLGYASHRIDEFIRMKRRLIKLLDEQRQVIVSDAVMRGRAQDVPLKSSGLDWLGEIPAHWGVVRNLALFSHRVEAGEPGLPVLQVSLRSGITVDETDRNGRQKRLIADATKYKRVHQGDIAYNTMRMWQGAVGVSPVDGLVSPAYVVLAPRPDSNPEFYNFLFHTKAYMQEINRQSTGIVSDRNRLYWDSFKQMSNVCVPRKEQDQIVEFIKSETAVLSGTIARTEKEISLMREYKSRLISDVVTGKIDIRGVIVPEVDVETVTFPEDDSEMFEDDELALAGGID